MNYKTRFTPFLVLVIVAMLLAACGGENPVTDRLSSEPAPTVVATRIVTQTQVLETAPEEEAVPAEIQVVTETLVVEVADSVPGDPVVRLGSNDQVVEHYLTKDANDDGTQTFVVPEDGFAIVSANPGCLETVCVEENPGFVALVNGPMTVTMQIPYGRLHVNASVTVYDEGNPHLALAEIQQAEGKASVFEIVDDTVIYYSEDVGPTDGKIEDLYLIPVNPAGERITFTVDFDTMTDVAEAAPENLVTLEDADSGAEICGNFNGEVLVIDGDFWLSSDGPVTYQIGNEDPFTQDGPQSAYGLNAQLTISDYPEHATRICVNAGADYGSDNKPIHLLFGDVAE